MLDLKLGICGDIGLFRLICLNFNDDVYLEAVQTGESIPENLVI